MTTAPTENGEARDAALYFVKNRRGAWAARAPFGAGYALYRDHPITRKFLGNALGMKPVAFVCTLTALAVLAALFAEVESAFRWPLRLIAIILASVPWVLVGTLEAAFIQIEHGAERENANKPTAAAKEFLKINTRRLAYTSNFLAVGLVALGVSAMEHS